MYSFSQAVTPAAKTYLQAQLSFYDELSKSIFSTVQQYTELNIQLAQTLLQEATQAGQQIFTSQRPTEALAAAAARAQPTVEKLRAYQQHFSRIAAEAQVDFSKVTEEHVQETSRTAKALAEEVARVTSAEAVEKFTDPFRAAGARFMRGAQTLQSAPNGAAGRGNGSLQGQATPAQTVAQAATHSSKQAGARKET
jgi:phasin family protein